MLPIDEVPAWVRGAVSASAATKRIELFSWQRHERSFLFESQQDLEIGYQRHVGGFMRRAELRVH